jgi:hypothetical protein
MTQTLEDLIDLCDGTHFAIAVVVHRLLRHRFVYLHDWYEFDPYSNEWLRQPRDHKLRVLISTVVSDAFFDRASHWERLSHSEDADATDETRRKAAKMARCHYRISDKLKNYEFKSFVVRECKCVFWVYRLEDMLSS